MKYQIEISGMHCMGCSSLIKMSLDDESELSDVTVDLKTNTASFESSLTEDSEIEKLINKVFKDLPGYSYKNIQTLS